MNELVKVDISIIDGLYIATSKDMLGLFVADRYVIGLIDEIPEVIKAIYKEQFNKNVTAEELTGEKNDFS